MIADSLFKSPSVSGKREPVARTSVFEVRGFYLVITAGGEYTL